MAAISHGRGKKERKRFLLGPPAMDAWLGGGLERAALHEITAEAADAGAAMGFVAALAVRAMETSSRLVWLRRDRDRGETGEIHGPGFIEFGLDPRAVSLLHLRATTDVLKAGIEAARCASLSVVVLEIQTDGREAGLTATRRLALAVEQSGVALFLLRISSGATSPSAAMTRWSVRPAASRPLPGEAPGRPCFDVGLVRHRAGVAEKNWLVEWDRDRRVFSQAISGPVVSFPVGRPVAFDNQSLRRAG